MELKGKQSGGVQTNKTTNNQNVNSMNINQGSETSGKASGDQSCTFQQACTISSPSATNSNSSSSAAHQPSNSVHPLDGHRDNVNRAENHLDAGHLDRVDQLDTGTNQPVNGTGSSAFKIEFNEANCLASSPSYANPAGSPCLNQIPNHPSSSTLNHMNSDLSFAPFAGAQLANDLENNPHLLNLSRSIGPANGQDNAAMSSLAASCMAAANMANCMTSGDAIPITNMPNGNQISPFNCSPQQQASFFTGQPANQPSDDQLNRFDGTFGGPGVCLAKTSLANFPATGGKETCATCSSQILDRYLLKVNGASYHEKCVFCCCCGGHLNSVCYQRNAKLYCKQDYLRWDPLFSTV